MVQLLSQRLDGAGPITELPLTKQPRRRIPRTVTAFAQPPEIGGEWQKQQQQFTHGAGKMRDSGIYGNHRVELRDGSGRIGKVGKFLPDLHDIGMRLEQRRVARAHIVLETDDLHVRQIEHGCQRLKFD